MAEKMKSLPPSRLPILEMMHGPIDERPIIRFTEDQLGEIRGWKTGEEYGILIKVKQIESRIVQGGEHEGKFKADFKVLAVKDYTEKLAEHEKSVVGSTTIKS